MTWLYLSAGTMVLTALLHSIFGERRLIVPLLQIDNELTQRQHVRRLVRFAWHATSLLMISSALVIIWPGTPRLLIAVTGVIWVFVGLLDAALTKAKHVGWPFLAGAGAFAILGVML